jgi:hypothetical protein
MTNYEEVMSALDKAIQEESDEILLALLGGVYQEMFGDCEVSDALGSTLRVYCKGRGFTHIEQSIVDKLVFCNV